MLLAAGGTVSDTFTPVVVAALTSSLSGLLLHYEVLRFLTYILPSIALWPRQKLLVVVAGAIVAHLLEVLVYAIAFWFLFEFDFPSRRSEMPFAEAFYLSIESYASLGTSTGFPVGQLRLLAGVEALVGLILIGWTASFTYLAMNRFWMEH